MKIIGTSTPSRGAFSIAGRVTPDADYFLAAQATSASATTTVRSFLNIPADIDCFRVAVLPGGTTADVPAGDITIFGVGWDQGSLSYKDITSVITLAANQATVELSTVPFKKIYSITFPIQDGADATYDVGIADDLLFKIPVANKQGLAITSIRVLLDGAPTALELLLGTQVSAHGGQFDQVLLSVDLDSLSAEAYVHDFPIPQVLVTGDTFSISYANAAGNIVGIETVGFFT